MGRCIVEKEEEEGELKQQKKGNWNVPLLPEKKDKRNRGISLPMEKPKSKNPTQKVHLHGPDGPGGIFILSRIGR
jgi:hypothetical protein